MGAALTFNTRVDLAVRRSGQTRSAFAKRARVSTSTLLKARACDPRRGKLHWTSLVLIGIELGIFRFNEPVREDDPRLRKIVPQYFVSHRGSPAHQWYGTSRRR